MKIVQIEDFVHPESGYQINILSKYFVKFGHDVTIVCSEMTKMPAFLTDFFTPDNIEEKDRIFEEQTGVKIVRVPVIKYVSGRSIYTRKIFKVVDELQPDILFLHSEDTAIAIQFLWKIEKKPYALIMDNHQCDMSSHNRFREQFRWFYRKTVTPIIKRNNYITVRLSEDDDYMQNHFDIPIELAPCITFGSDMLLFHPDDEIRRSFREKYDISQDAIVFVYAGKLDQYKGGKFLAEVLSEKLQLTNGKEIVFIVVGNTSGEYGKEVEELLEKSENRILRFPTQKYIDLARFFQASDVGLIAKECSLTFFDYQACGLPVVVEENDVNVSRLDSCRGMTFKKENTSDFREKIINMASLDDDTMQNMKKASYQFILENYNYEDKARQFEDLMIKETERQTKKMMGD